MTVGMTCFILLAMYIQYESSYDLQHENADRIYRIAQHQEGNEFRGRDRFAVSPQPLVPSMKAQFPEVEEGTTFTFSGITINKGEDSFFERGYATDSSFFKVFTHQVIEGDVYSALKDKAGIILTESLAEKYFGKVSAMGESLNIGNDQQLVVKAVIEDVPDNQQIQFDFIRSIENDGDYIEDRKNQRWSSNNYWSYVGVERRGRYPSLRKENDSIWG